MKILLYGAKRFGGNKYFVPLRIADHIHRSVPTNALVDTGSSHTLISEKDADRCKFPFTRVKPEKEFLIIWNANLKLYPCCSKFWFHDLDTNKIVKIKHNVHFCRGADSKSRGISYYIPNIIGNDFLSKNSFTIAFEPDGKVYLKNNIYVTGEYNLSMVNWTKRTYFESEKVKKIRRNKTIKLIIKGIIAFVIIVFLYWILKSRNLLP